MSSGSIHENIYEIPNVACMMSGHLNSGDVNTEFSSWAASLSMSLCYIYHDDPEARISIIDTRKFPETAIYHVPHLSNVGVNEESMYEEYLLHGVLEAGMLFYFLPSVHTTILGTSKFAPLSISMFLPI